LPGEFFNYWTPAALNNRYPSNAPRVWTRCKRGNSFSINLKGEIMENKYRIQFTVNEAEYDLLVHPNKTLLDLLRYDLGLTGTKEGCDEGDCGACTVIVNGKVMTACLVLAVEVDGAAITTIEGLHQGDELHPIQQAFVDSGAVQCGFCTPGMILTTKALLDEMPDPSEEDIKHYLEGNLCRCTGYTKILDAVNSAVQLLK
jgi:aerobic-type carbon monoxide dehydrogenase small subunit (CoxS/CutS family)